MKRMTILSCTSTQRLRKLIVCVALLATLSLLFLIVYFLPARVFQNTVSNAVGRRGELSYTFYAQFSNGSGDDRVHSRNRNKDNLIELGPASQVVGPSNTVRTVQSPTTEALSPTTVTTGPAASASQNIILSAPAKSHAVLLTNKSETEVTAATTLSTSHVIDRKSRPTASKNGPSLCRTKNCEEFLSVSEKRAVHNCLRDTSKHPGINVEKGTCRFLSDRSRQAVALASPEGSGNTWLRGLLERATGVCTGFGFCDYEARARGFAGEGVISGRVLVVKTHLVHAQWIGHVKKVTWDGQYSSAVFLIRNPARSLIAEWNRRRTNDMKGKTHGSPINDSHTNAVSEEFFLTEKWGKFSEDYLNAWIWRLKNWVFNHSRPVYVVNYEDLMSDTVRQVEKILDFLQFPYSHEEVVERLRVDYTDFRRSHTHDDFQHFSPEQKEKLRSTLLTAMTDATASGKANLFLFNEYLDSLPDIK